jgi:hypothetical protein
MLFGREKSHDEDVFHCYYFGLVWFQARGGRHARLQGHYRGGNIFEAMTEETVYVADDTPRRKAKAPAKRDNKRLR